MFHVFVLPVAKQKHWQKKKKKSSQNIKCFKKSSQNTMFRPSGSADSDISKMNSQTCKLEMSKLIC